MVELPKAVLKREKKWFSFRIKKTVSFIHENTSVSGNVDSFYP